MGANESVLFGIVVLKEAVNTIFGSLMTDILIQLGNLI